MISRFFQGLTKLSSSLTAGYTGNGIYCYDIDECLVNNGGCSMNPYVECTNTLVSTWPQSRGSELRAEVTLPLCIAKLSLCLKYSATRLFLV